MWKGVMGMCGGWGKMCRICTYGFWNLKVYKWKNVLGYPITHYLGICSKFLQGYFFCLLMSSFNHITQYIQKETITNKHKMQNKKGKLVQINILYII